MLVSTCRHAFGDQYRATDVNIPGKGRLTMTFVPEDGGSKQVGTLNRSNKLLAARFLLSLRLLICPCSKAGCAQPVRVFSCSLYRTAAHSAVSGCQAACKQAFPVTQEWEIHQFDGPGVAMGMYNTEQSIAGFAQSCFEYALDRQW